MYDWLENELVEIKTNKFHRVEKQEKKNNFWELDWSHSIFPPSYLSFMYEFGNASLYRKGSGYQIGVFAPPKSMKTKDGEDLLYFGYFDGERAYFRWSLLTPNKETPIFEWDEDHLEQVADDFQEWLMKRSTEVHKKYTNKEWQQILRGPLPFTDKEQAIVEARKHFTWQEVGFAENGDVRILVKNSSNTVLAYYSLGLRSKAGLLKGGLWL